MLHANKNNKKIPANKAAGIIFVCDLFPKKEKEADDLYVVLLQLSEVLDRTNHLRSVRVLIVIPRNNLYLIAIIANLAYHGLSCIEQ